MIYGYYPGCCLNTTCKDFDTSLRSVLKALDMPIRQVKRWSCCGSSAVHIASRQMAASLAMTNLAKAEEQGFEQMLVPCAYCYARFKFAMHEMDKDPELRQNVEDTLKHKFTGRVKIIHPLEFFATEEIMKRVSSSRKRDLSSLKVVCYYGCFLSRPPDHFENAEFPQTMDRTVKAAGATVLDWGYRTDCCGGNFSLTRTDIALKLTKDILDGAKQAGADAIVVTCPFCHMNMDARQSEIEAKYSTKYGLPVYYYSQVLAAALGAPEKELMLRMHFVHPQRMLEKAGSHGKQ
ncbi:MAG: CoB--CoM heterodisulfide reductase iron-sulfur subunit B family protein [Dehalococcoidales bacterium]